MDCNRIQDRLVDYLTEETRITERLCVDVHLATCYHCREVMVDVRTVLDGAKDSIRYAGPERSFEAAMNEIRTREALLTFDRNGATQQSRQWSWGVLASALPIVVACVTPFVVAWPGALPSITADDAPDAVTETMVEADRQLHELADPARPAVIDLLRPIP